MKIFFRLGKNANLAYAEVISYLKTNEYKYELDFVNQNVAVFDIDRDVDFLFINNLGGTVKVGEMIGSGKSLDAVKKLVMQKLESLEGKKVFGFSVLDNIKEFSLKELNNLGMEIKNELGSARFVTSKEKELSSVIVKNEKLLRKGGEFILFNSVEGLQIGITKAVQDFKDFEKRDYGRPRSDSKSGMLPPKLAVTMINILDIKNKDAKILDPFCGSGTILQELLLKGFKNVIGADISEKAIDDTKINLEWLEKNYNISIDNVELYNVDAKEIAQHVKTVDGIITEPFLGPALRGGETKDYIMKNKIELENLYMRVFKTFSKIVKDNGKIVIVVPAFKYKEEIIYLDILHKIASYGFTLQTSYKNLNEKNYRSNLMYFRPDAKVLREVMVFKKD